MTWEEEVEHVKTEHPRVWEWLLGVDSMKVSLPHFDDDDEPHYERSKTMTYGIDVSENNGNVNWQAVADAGMKFAIVRSSYGRYAKDEDFVRNVNGAHDAGLQCGAYHYSYAMTPEQARQEARNCKQIIDEAGVLLELPVWFDMEDADGYKRKHGFDFSADNVTAICRAFLDEIKPLDCGIYASLYWLENHIDWRSLGCAVWNAQWSDRDDIQGYMWQYTDALNIGGKAFDGNLLYHDI